MNPCVLEVVPYRAVPGCSDKMFYFAFLEFPAAILLQCGAGWERYLEICTGPFCQPAA
jgi:hypothetical protein